MVDMAAKCPLRIGNEDQVKFKLGTTIMVRPSPLGGFPRPVASLPCVQAQARLKRFQRKVKWTLDLHLGWVDWVADAKVLVPRDYPIKL